MKFSENVYQIDRPLVLATRNRGKAAEFKALFSGTGVEIKDLRQFGPIPEVDEDGETFEDNAVKKARFTARVLGFPALADDSGLTVAALNGNPGVRSARFAGEGATDESNNLKLIDELDGIEDRAAAFVCVIAIAVPRGPALIYKGRCEGVVTDEMRGRQGFGYDPLFYYPPAGKTFAEMIPQEKNRVSHRGRAMAELKAELDKVFIWLRQRLEEEPRTL
ncbi:MAG: XTP/dITP diphosphatase [Deltaproteobacteria bacterium]|nr:XTP/dITP diphosphatase [Deltaproteobacteria bacterium]